MGRGRLNEFLKSLRSELARWSRRRRAYRAQLAYAVWDLRERYGPAAHGIARNSARQVVGFERRRFWNKVAGRLRRDRMAADFNGP
jgi:hypothetical protein